MNRYLSRFACLTTLACVSFVFSGYAAAGAQKARLAQVQNPKQNQRRPVPARPLLAPQPVKRTLPTRQNAALLQQKKLLANKNNCQEQSSSSSSSSSCDKGEWDYVIIGAGTAGATLAAKLSDPDHHGRFKNSVLVLETGQNETTNPAVLDVSFGLLSTLPLSIDNTFSKAFTVSLTNEFQFPGTPSTEGRTWGGSSAHSNILMVRGTPANWNKWASLSGNPRWLYNNMLNTVMKPLEHFVPNVDTPANPAQRGFSGPVFITQETPPLDSDPFQLQLAAGFFTTLIPDYNDPTYGDVGVSNSQDNVTPPFAGPGSIRSFSGNAFLTGEPSVGIPAIVDANGNGLNGRKLKIVSGAYATRVLFSSSKRAKGVEYFLSSDTEQLLVVKAKKKVILSAGGIMSPAILQRSGYGDASLLSSLDIPVVFDNPNVGQHLMDHAAGQAFVNMTTIPLPAYSNGYFDLPAITGTTTQRIMQTWQFPSAAFFPAAISHILGISTGTDIAYLNVTPKSEGRVVIANKNPIVEPNVFYNFYSDGGPSDLGSDANKMVEFLKQLKTAFPAAYPGPGSVLYPTPDMYAAGDDSLFQSALDTAVITYHPSCTCRMATSAADGVVDGDLHVFGVQNLMVADNSAAAVINDGNTQTQAFYIGAMAAQIIRGS